MHPHSLNMSLVVAVTETQQSEFSSVEQTLLMNRYLSTGILDWYQISFFLFTEAFPISALKVGHNHTDLIPPHGQIR